MVSIVDLLITTRRVGALPLVAAAAVVRGRRAMPVAAVVVLTLAVAVPAAAVIVVVSVPPTTSVISIVTSTGRLAHVYPRRGRVGPLRDGIVHADAASVDLHSGALVLRHFRVSLGLVVHETETAGTAGLGVNNNLDLLNRSKFSENIINLLLGGVKTETENAETPGWGGILLFGIAKCT